MSDDLISRNDLLGTEQLLMTDIVKDNPTARYILEQVLYDIENTPTAYDVDKVVEQLENAKTNFIGMGTLQSAYFDKGIDKAIEIVKSGGVAND